MVDRHVLSNRLSALEGYLVELRGFREVSRERFIREPALHHLAERYLQLACETVLDMAQHLISDLGLRQAGGYKDAMDVLAEEGILERSHAESLKGWMGFRNVLVHLYLEIDHGKAWDAIREELGELRRFAERVGRFLADEGPGPAGA